MQFILQIVLIEATLKIEISELAEIFSETFNEDLESVLK